MMVETESYQDEFLDTLKFMEVNPFDQEEVAQAAIDLEFEEFAEFCREVSEDIYLIKAREWYEEENV
jgi:hypothetical protein